MMELCAPVSCPLEVQSVELDGTEGTNLKRLAHMNQALKTATTFEIHCWNEETEVLLWRSDTEKGRTLIGDMGRSSSEMGCQSLLRFCWASLSLPKLTSTTR